MKHLTILRFATLTGVVLVACASYSQFDLASPRVVSQPQLNAKESYPAIARPADSLTKSETEGLLYMREEEKLAQDVYDVLTKRWGTRPFGNIARAEFSHTSWVKALITKYKISDPASTLSPGKFENGDLQKLYTSLVKLGSESRISALKVGATIEDVDLFDLARWSKEPLHEDIKNLYENLARGSRNHMRAFHRNLTRAGGAYKPQYISQEVYDKIVGSPTERGMDLIGWLNMPTSAIW